VVTAYFAIGDVYHLSYTAGRAAFVTGSVGQNNDLRRLGHPVHGHRPTTGLPLRGLVGRRTDNPRTGHPTVTRDISVTANFAIKPIRSPYIAAIRRDHPR